MQEFQQVLHTGEGAEQVVELGVHRVAELFKGREGCRIAGFKADELVAVVVQATVVHQHFQRGSEVDVHAAGGVGIAVGHTGFGTARNGIVQRLVDRAALDGVQGHHFLVVD